MPPLIEPAAAGLLAQLADATILCDAAGRIILLNPAAAALAGVPPDEALGRDLADLLALPPEAGLPPGSPWRGQAEVLRRGGVALAVDATVQAVQLQGGAAGIFVLARPAPAPAPRPVDRALQLQEYAARIDSLLNNAPIGIALLDTELRYQHVNARLAQKNGLPVARHLGQTLREVVPGLADTLEPIYREVLATGEPRSKVELTDDSAADPGVMRIWEASYFPVRVRDDAIIGVGMILIDVTAQRQLEAALQAEREQLVTILETMQEAVIALRPDGTIAMLNGMARQMSALDTAGATIQEVDAQSFRAVTDLQGALLPPEQWPSARALRGERFRAMDVRLHLVEGGGELMLSFSGAPLFDAQGRQTLAILTAHDIRAHQQAEQELRASWQTLREVTESADGPIWAIDREYRLVVGNRAFLELSASPGGPPPEPGDHTLFEWLPAEQRAALQADYDRALAGERLVRVFEDVGLPAGPRTVEYRVNPMRDTRGAIVGAVVFGRDITDQARAEVALRDTERKLGALFDILPVGVAIVDAQGSIVYANPAHDRLLGAGYRGVVNGAEPISRFHRPDGSPRLPHEFATVRAFEERQPVTDVESGVAREGGELVWVSASAAPVDIADWRVVTVVTDVSQRRRDERALQEQAALLSRTNHELAHALQLKDEFLAMMSHELRTPLSAVLGSADLLLEDVYGPLVPDQRQAVDVVRRAGRHLLDMLTDILDLTRLGAGGVTLDLAPVAVEDVCADALRAVQERAALRGIRLAQRFPFGIEGLRADGRRLLQILTNLLDNAVKFTPEGGTVELSVAADAGREQISFTVSDTGIGIAAEQMGRLFKPFTQVDGRLARAHGGIGLGLTLVQRLTELHGGSVSLESTPGRGSHFTVTFPWAPADRATPRAAPPAPRAPAWRRTPHVLVVDDDEMTVAVFSDALVSWGCRVTAAGGGAEALDRIRAEVPDVVVLDIQMPEVDGMEVIRRLRASPETAGLPILAVTALAMPGDRERCLAAGATRYLAKPVGLRTLAAQIAEVLEPPPES